jgi:hypothetical protein
MTFSQYCVGILYSLSHTNFTSEVAILELKGADSNGN